MLLLLLGATAVYMLLGDPQQAILLGASVVLVIGLTVYQEQKSERALQALRDALSPADFGMLSHAHLAIVIAGPASLLVETLIWNSWYSRLKALRFHW